MNEEPSKTQHARFIETACALGYDESEAAFDEKLKAVAWQRPKDEAAKPKKARDQ